MSLRELIILLLGLAIVVVILRGLYVAIQARRSQIRLSIDKNIPQDVNLEELELSEFPSGGARSVARSLEVVNKTNGAIEIANAQAEQLGLSGNCTRDPIPILMDAVSLSEGAEIEFENHSSLDLGEQEKVVPDELSRDQTSRAAPFAPFENVDTAVNGSNGVKTSESGRMISEVLEDEDTIIPNLSAYPENECYEVESLNEFQEANFNESFNKENVGEILSDTEYQESGFEHHDLDGVPNNSSEDECELDRNEPGRNLSFEDSLDEFSMTAGERIGYDQNSDEEIPRHELFEDFEYENQDAEHDQSSKSTKLKSLISVFGLRKAVREKDLPEQKDFPEEDSEERDGEDKLLQQTQIIRELEDFFEEDDNKDFVQRESSVEQEDDLREVFEGEDKPHNVANFEKALATSELDVRECSRKSDSLSPDSLHSSEVLVVNVMASRDTVFLGDELLRAFVKTGLIFGEMDVFHCYAGDDSEECVIFSVANALNPGSFDLGAMQKFSTIGISFFLMLPTNINNLQALEYMIDVAQEVCEILDGELKDDHRNVMTAQTIEHYRQRIRDFELRQLKAAGSRG